MLLTCFIILISSTFFGLFYHATGTITLLTTPSLLCEQDVVVFNCTLSSGITYGSNIAGLSINGSTTCIAGADIYSAPGKTGVVPRFNLTGFGETTTAPAAQYTISPFLSQDNATRYRCCAIESAPPFTREFTADLSLPFAAPPSAPTSLNISAYLSSTSCYGTITLAWSAVASDRPVTSYEVLLNGTVNATITTPMAMNSYTTGTLNLLEHYATYTVMATSCAGSSVPSSAVTFTPLTTALTPSLPSAPSSLSLSFSYLSPTSCYGTITLTWLAVISDRNVTGYTVYLNNTTMVGYTNTTTVTTGTLNLLQHYATYTARAINCVGSGVPSSAVMFTPLTTALTPNPPSAASISISTAYDSATSCTGTITLTWLAVTSDRNVTSYEVYLNGTNVMKLTPTAGTNTYTTASMSLATFNGRYTVRAVSCAGSSVSNEVVLTPPTPSTPIIAIPPNITSLQPSSCRARIEFTLQQPADSRNVTSYYLFTTSTVIQSLTANANNMYSFYYYFSFYPAYYDFTLNIAENLYITAVSCVGYSSPSLLTLPTVQGVSAVEVTGTVVNANSSVSFNLLFTGSTFPAAVSFTVDAYTFYTNGTFDYRVLYSGVQISGTMSSLNNIPIPHLASETPLGLNRDVYCIFVFVSADFQCGQALNLNSFVPIDIAATPSTTAPTSTTSISTTSISSTSASTTPSFTKLITVNYVNSSTSPITDCQTYCPCTTCNVKITNSPILAATTNYTPISTGSSLTNDDIRTPYLVVIIILVLLLLFAIFAIAILILFTIYSSKKNNSAPENQQNTNTDDPIYNYIALAETNEEKHYHSEMVATNPFATTAIDRSLYSELPNKVVITNPTTSSTATTNDKSHYTEMAPKADSNNNPFTTSTTTTNDNTTD